MDTKINYTWKYFYLKAEESFKDELYSLTKAYLSASLTLDNEDSDLIGIYQLLYKTHNILGDKLKAKEILEICVSLEPSDRNNLVEWYKNFENIKYTFIAPEPIGQIDSKIYSTFEQENAEDGTIKPDWYIYLPEGNERLITDIVFAIKVGNDNSKNFVELENGGYMVTRKLCEKLGVEPTDFMLKELATERRQIISLNK